MSKFPAENGGVTTEFDESSSAVIYPKMVVAREAEPDKFLVNFGYFVGVTYKGDAAGVWASIEARRRGGSAARPRASHPRRVASASSKQVPTRRVDPGVVAASPRTRSPRPIEASVSGQYRCGIGAVRGARAAASLAPAWQTLLG